MTTQSIRVGVVGVGYLGAIHARIYAAMSGVELVGVTDIDGHAATRVAEECGCSAYNEPEALLDKADAVSIVVPTSSHRVVAEHYLRHGMHVLLEKPIADHLTNARAVVKAAEETGVILQIGHLERFNAGVVRLVQELDRPRFIEVHRLGPFVSRAADVDVVTDLMIHDIDIVLSLVSADLTYVSAVGARVVSSHVDIANARLEFADGTIANVTASRVSSRKFRRRFCKSADRGVSTDTTHRGVRFCWDSNRVDRSRYSTTLRCGVGALCCVCSRSATAIGDWYGRDPCTGSRRTGSPQDRRVITYHHLTASHELA